MGSDSYSIPTVSHPAGKTFSRKACHSIHQWKLKQLESQPLDSGSLEKWLFMVPCVRSLPVGQHFPLYLTHKQSWRRVAVKHKMESPDELNRHFYTNTSDQNKNPTQSPFKQEHNILA